MRVKFLVLILTFAPFAAMYAEEPRWHLGLGFSPDFCFRSVHNTGKDTQQERVKVGYTLGMWARHDFNDLLQMEFGLQYSSKGYTYNVVNPGFRSQTDPGSSPLSLPLGFYARRRFEYLDIPLKMNVTVAKLEKQSLHFTGGVAMNILLKEKNTGYQRFNAIGDIVEMSDIDNHTKSFNLTAFMGLGLDIRLKEKIHLQVDPLFRYGMVPVYKNDPAHTRLWSFGVNSTLYFRL